ncbi:hypothetical protein B296_00023712 [Ensete ventricosum]|uniref:Uncharacterized protein n=1 Tax=Ensete ventricosum TaxID=4639 RepID=A0A426YH01_ENSVE|nr:hypothetical protein B296_00023712 [Ensete ventricosum]
MLPSTHIAAAIVIVVAFISTRSYPLPHQSHATPVVPSLIAISISSKKGTSSLSSSSHILYHYNPLALSHITRCYLCPLATPVTNAAAATTIAQPPSSSPLNHYRWPDHDSAQPMVARPFLSLLYRYHALTSSFPTIAFATATHHCPSLAVASSPIAAITDPICHNIAMHISITAVASFASCYFPPRQLSAAHAIIVLLATQMPAALPHLPMQLTQP